MGAVGAAQVLRQLDAQLAGRFGIGRLATHLQSAAQAGRRRLGIAEIAGLA